MIQRIQTVYLALGVVALGALFFVAPPYVRAAAMGQSWVLPVIYGLAGLAAFVALGAIFLFKDRPKQRRVIVGAQVLTVLHLVALYGGLFLADALYVRTTAGLDAMRLLTLLLPLLAYLLFWLARRGVDRDIALVKSMDRLR